MNADGISQTPTAPAVYASDPNSSRGRLFEETESSTRSVFQRDRDRILHSSAFRRLKYKTQVFVYHEGDHYRTRLTHSLEVAQIARSLARALGTNEDMAEALALAHDLGHPPFGHAGEDALQIVMEPYGGFDHNGQAIRIVTRLEARYADFDGLNLTWETLEGLAKHNGPLIAKPLDTKKLPWALAEYASRQDLEWHTQPGIEAQIAAIADDIAYNTHDVDDGLRAGLFSVEDLREVLLVGPVIAEVTKKYPNLEKGRVIHESTRRMIDRMVSDLLTETRSRLEEFHPESPEAVRKLDKPVVALSRDMMEMNRGLKAFLFERMYRHPRVNRMTNKAGRVITDLFQLFVSETGLMPVDWQRKLDKVDDTGRARMVADYIAGMTDRFALEEHKRQFDLYE
jgi:dGTPase